MMTMTIDGTVA